MDTERRAHTRFACDLDVSLETGNGMRLDAKTVDVSQSGIAVITAASVGAGADVTFHLRLKLEGVESDTLSLPSNVVWCTATRGEFQVGAAFRDPVLTEKQRSGLDVLLRFLSGELGLDNASHA